MARALEFVEDSYSEPLTLEDLSAKAIVSKSSLQRAFRKHLGCTPLQYVMRLRMERGAELLVETSLSVTEIAESVGFADSNHFSRRFRQYAGQSPSAFRNQAREGPELS